MIFLKTGAEIAIMRENGKILIDVFDRLREIIKPGISTKVIDKLVEDVILSYSAVPSFKNYGPRVNPFPASACVSVNEEVVHGIPSARKLQEGDIVSVDIGAYRDGFHVDACRTYTVGKVSDEAMRLIDVTKQSFFAGLEKAVIGNRVSDISAAVQKYAEAAGYGVVRDLLGHGIGRSLHEEPSVPNFGAPGRGPKLRAGMLLAIEPMITEGDYRVDTLKDGWTVVTRDRKLAAHYENTVAITPEGAECLTLGTNFI